MEPIIVIVGFLGTGKTTLLQRLTKDYLNLNWNPWVILNDYQNASIDSQRFLDLLPREVVNPLNGSCICCSGVNELREIVNDIPKREKGVTLIEANGTTDACTLMGFLGVGLNDNFLPPIQISIVDVRNWQKRGEYNQLESSQIQVSSLIVLNFTQELTADQNASIRADIQQHNPEAEIRTFDEIDALWLPGLQPSQNKPKQIDHQKSHWASCSVDLPDSIDSSRLDRIMKELPKSILRVKAITRLNNDAHYSMVEKTPTGEITIRKYNNRLLSGPKFLTIGPGSDPGQIQYLVNKEIQDANIFCQ